MKKINKLVFILLIVVISNTCYLISAQEIFINSQSDTTANLDELYSYPVTAVTPVEKLPITYSLVKSLSGMTINYPSPGVIRWTPGSLSAGGKVTVKATNSANESAIQEFNIYISNEISCPTTLISYWKFEETTGTVFSDYYSNNDAFTTLTGAAPASISGKSGNALQFNPDNNNELYIKDNTDFDWGINDNFAVEFWISVNDADIDNTGVIIGKNAGADDVHWWIGVDADAKINFVIRENSTDYAQCLSATLDNAWHHILAVRDASNEEIRLYVDGQPAGSDSYDGTGPGLTTDSLLTIGWLKPGAGDGGDKYPYEGKLDELAVHNTALDGVYALARFNKGNAGIPICREGNFAPLFLTSPKTLVKEDSIYSYYYQARDIDNDPLTYIISKPAWLSHITGDKLLEGTPANENVGEFPVIIKVNDGSADTITQSFTITVGNVNDKPVLSDIESSALTYTEGDAAKVVSSSILVEDVDDLSIESATILISKNYQNGEDQLLFSNTPNITGTWNSSSGKLTLNGTDTKGNYQSALHSVTYRNASEDPSALTRIISFNVSDGEIISDTAKRNITVVPVNDLPQISNHLPVNTPEDDTVLIKPQHLLYTDVDNTLEETGISVLSGNNYTYSGNIVKPDTNYNGTINVNVQLSDLNGSVDYIIPVTVTPVNDAPYYTFTPDLQANEGEFYFSPLSAEDVDEGDVLTFTLVQKPSWLQLTENNLTGKPGFANVGVNTVTINVTDTKVNVDTTFIIYVTTTNRKPFISSTPLTAINEDIEYVYNIEFTDPDANETLVFYPDIIPDWLTYDNSLRRLSGTPTNDEVGYKSDSAYVVQLRVSDTKQDSIQTFAITVYNVNDAPEISGQPNIPHHNTNSTLTIGLDDLNIEDVDNLTEDLNLTIFGGEGYSVIESTITITSTLSEQIEINIVVDDGALESGVYGYKVNLNDYSAINGPDDDIDPVRIYPVPSIDYFIVEYNIAENGWFEIVTAEGRLVQKYAIGKNSGPFEISAGDLPSGIYFYKLYTSNELYTGKLIIDKK